MQADNTVERREFWTLRMEQGYEFMQQVMQYPVCDNGEKLCSLPVAAQEAGLLVAFSGRPHVQDLPRLYFLREGQIEGFLKAAENLNRRGWMLKVEDGYRSRTMQKFIGRTPAVFDAILRKTIWELDGRKPDAEFLFRRILTLTAQMPKIGTHMSGSAIDISVLNLKSGEEIDRGAPYLEMSEKTPMDSPFISAEAQSNRAAITAIMGEAGFVAYPYEFWHYNSGDAYAGILQNQTGPAGYGAVEWSEDTGQVKPVELPLEPLNSLVEIEAEIKNSLERLHLKD